MDPIDLTPRAPDAAPAAEPVHGAWVKFDLDIPGAHRTADGACVGVYQRRAITPRVTRTTAQGEEVISEGGQVIPAHVAPIRPDGTNLMRLSDDGNHAVKVAFAPGDCPGLRPADVAGDVPRDRPGTHVPA